ncbi:MAG: cryptochrome/photolyase family protein [Alphaproteobacteria bacterium]|nr:cryptochrome/photolyase family protein [Alphaproteobacteria bacterium]
MTTLRFVLGDQLSPAMSSLRDIDPDRDIVLMAEVAEETTYAPHHKKKIAFILAAMRHFAEALRARGILVDYVTLDAPGNSGSFTGELARAVGRHRADRVVVTEPGEWRVLAMMRDWADGIGVPVEIRDDDRFFCSVEEFRRWAGPRRSLRMEFFYREMRRRHRILIDAAGDPEGGQWNLDRENRKPLPDSLDPPPVPAATVDAITTEVLDLVARRFEASFGDLLPFGLAVTPADAEAAFAAFLRDRLPLFGDYQDAMRRGAPHLWHSAIAPYLNAGLLDARDVVRRVEAAYRQGNAPLNAAEGFIRQVLGWREFVRGLYWTRMPGYAATNALDARRPLPGFYWTGDTDMRCLAETIADTRRNAYAHHIQRLMVTGNFALLAGIAPREIEAWYLGVYADAFDWVELPNTHGMVMFADGGMLASKPYAASGKYIDRMSDYCVECRYDVARSDGPTACPFNFLYWAFLDANAATLAGNPRLAMAYRTLRGFTPARRAQLARDAREFLERLT